MGNAEPRGTACRPARDRLQRARGVCEGDGALCATCSDTGAAVAPASSARSRTRAPHRTSPNIHNSTAPPSAFRGCSPTFATTRGLNEHRGARIRTGDSHRPELRSPHDHGTRCPCKSAASPRPAGRRTPLDSCRFAQFGHWFGLVPKQLDATCASAATARIRTSRSITSAFAHKRDPPPAHPSLPLPWTGGRSSAGWRDARFRLGEAAEATSSASRESSSSVKAAAWQRDSAQRPTLRLGLRFTLDGLTVSRGHAGDATGQRRTDPLRDRVADVAAGVGSTAFGQQRHSAAVLGACSA